MAGCTSAPPSESLWKGLDNASTWQGMELAISSPCPMTWEDLVGNDRVRYCGQCRLNVYDLTVMTPVEIERLVHRTEGRLCGRLYVREDRRATLRDCPAGRSGIVRRRIWKLAAAFFALAIGLACRGLDRPDLSGWPRWVQSVATWIDPEIPPFRRSTLGEMTAPKAPPAPVRPPVRGG